MTKPTIEEQLQALAVLRAFADLVPRCVNPTTGELEVVEAINTLDNADLFADLDAEAFDREGAAVPRTPVAIVKQRPTLFQAQGADGKIWATATTYKGVHQHLTELPTAFVIVSPDQLPQHAPTCTCGGSLDGRRDGIGCTEQPLDPAEWADTTRKDMARHNERHATTYTVHPAPEEG